MSHERNSVAVLASADRLYKMGFSILWLQANSKAPVEKKWTTGPRKTWKELRGTFRNGYNLGVRLGRTSDLGDGRYLCAIDCDVKSVEPHHKLEMNNKVRELFGDSFSGASVLSGRGNGSMHIYAATTEPVKPKRLAQSSEKVRVLMPSAKKFTDFEIANIPVEDRAKGWHLRPAWEISLMGEGQQCVLPPSIHPDSGKPYRWSILLSDVEQLPTLDIESVKAEKAVAKEVDVVKGEMQFVDVALWNSSLSDKMIKLIEEGEGSDDRSASLMSAALAMCGSGFKDNEILSVLTDRSLWLGEAAFEHTKSTSRSRAAEWVLKYTLQKAREETNAANLFDTIVSVELDEAESKVQEAEVSLVSWKDQLERVNRREDSPPKCTLKNLLLILENTLGENGVYRDLFLMRDYLGVNAPWSNKKANEELTDQDAIDIKAWIANRYRFEPSVNLVEEAMLYLAGKYSRHPVRERLNSLPEWDGVNRIDTWLKDYMGADMVEPYLSSVSRKFLFAMIERVMRPGCKFDFLLTLKGSGGIGKSTIGRLLVGDKWYCDTLPDIKDKDAMLNLQGAWVVEISELAVLKHAYSAEAYKAFLSRTQDRLRPPFGRRWADFPRQCVFIGTTNEDQYLRDKTGNRRFWPVTVTETLDFDKFKEDADQLLSEAYFEWRNFREPLYLEGEAKEQSVVIQEEHLSEDESTFLAHSFEKFETSEMSKPIGDRFDFSHFRLDDLFDDFGPFSTTSKTMQNRRYAGEALRSLGYEKANYKEGKFWSSTRARVARVTHGSHGSHIDEHDDGL